MNPAIHPIERSTRILWTPELILKVGALVLSLGLLIGKLNAMDNRLQRIEQFLDTHVVIQAKP